ncbi:unnamed protein product [Bursaphelenchus xylophilus]|uniref:Biogenesis of lysosome-related organelles complex 1 subunit 7 n=1 Tax=Bursaphelenchus xylophilus TaxID=6326 RepID=A0A1I7SER7_BURXY|nr:unnamed protein product [Bursaphelenchus xylophilus]CAG9128297.1 unnamed protein product [Bursaphelenchus xylophilus]
MAKPGNPEPAIGGGNDISEGIMDIVRPALQTLDAQVKETRKSQIHLGENIQKLSEYLKEILDEKQMPFDLGDYVRRLDDSTKRIYNVQSRIQVMHEKMTHLQRQIARETFKQKQSKTDGVVTPTEQESKVAEGSEE